MKHPIFKYLELRPILWLMIALMIVGVAQAQPVRITDYDVPISHANRMDFSSLIHLNGQDNRTNMRYDANGYWERYYNSLPYAYRWVIDGRISILDDNRRDWTGRARKASYRENVIANSELRKYVEEDGLFFFGMAADAAWRYNYKHADFWVGGSVGLGRFIIATALAKALRIEEFLIKEEILDNHLSKETMLNLAAIIEREDEYRKRYGDTYTVWWYADMDTAIMAAGLIPGKTVGPVGLLRMREVIERETVRPRMHGWKIETGAGIKFSDAYESKTVGTQPFISAAYGYPIGLKSQVYLTGRASAEPDDRIGKLFHLYGELTFAHELTNRIDFMLSEAYQHSKKEEAGTESCTNITTRENLLQADFLFYLENKVTLTTYAQLRHRNYYRSDPGFSSREIQRDWQLGASFSYRVF